MDTNALIIEYSQNPSNKYIIDTPSVRYREMNRVCSDVIEVFLRIDDAGIISESRFDGYMSIVATASAAITCETIVWLDVQEVLGYDEATVQSWVGDDISPRRRNASLIGLLAVKNAIHTFRNDGIVEDFTDIYIDR